MKALVIMGLFGIIAPALSAQNTITIEGVVVNRVTAEGISGVTVRVIGAPPGAILTNESGGFRVTGLKPGDYMAFADKQGYFSVGPIQFHVNEDGSPIRPRLELLPPAILRGRVLGIDGKPARATVDIGPGSRGSVRTNEDGYFAFEQLEPGTYILLGRPDKVEPVSSQEGLRTESVPTYYPSVLDRIQAESIALRPGAELNGYEIRLQSAPVYRISGIVLDPAGKPAPDAVVQLLDTVENGFTGFNTGKEVVSIGRSSPADTLNATQSTTTGDDGMFEFSSVWPGEWTIHVESDSMRDDIQQTEVIAFGSSTIILGRRDLDDLQIRLAIPMDLSGTVERSDISPDRFVAVTLTGESGYFGGTAHPDGDGRLRFEGVIPGRYLISTGVAGNYYASVLMGSIDVTGQTVELTASSPPIRVVIKRGGTVRWALEQSNSWTVLLMPQTLTGLCYLASSLARGSDLIGIPPGEYYVIALDDLVSRTITYLPRLRELVPRATSIRIQEGSDTFVQLKINHAPD